ncbi:thiol reductant ABC exporter subunit CydC [Kaistia algarum]|uniref:thiol reductant ABC exporter subunit CydC n=1 Tax=Kaistia algarum TaxID=2083279 RepID=UPI000CE8BBDE|nr:thiol reductant ABC exporter subunit CydC [Kaistia algarum]MCX5515287.1 thiol reductant ABC exporter subunit CydC [Kaistia algarum]PPE77698.1 thiol reductant ABC exporter subunit CydC [Kaistia algarum]
MSVLSAVVKRRLGALALAWLLAVITLMAGMALLGVSGWFLTATALAGAVSFNLFIPSSLVRGFAFIRIVSRYGERVTGHAATLSILSDLRVLVFSRLIPIVPIRGAAMRTGDFVARLTADIEALDMVFLQALLPIGAALVALTSLAVVLGFFLPEAVWIGVGGFAVTTLLVPLILSRLGGAPGTAVVARSADLRMLALDGVDGQADIVALGIQPAIDGDFAKAARSLRAARLAQARWTALGPAAMQFGAGATLVGVLWFGLGAFTAGRISGPLLVGELLAVLASFEASGAVLRGAGRLGGALAASKRVRGLLDAAPAVVEPKKPAPLPAEGVLSVEHIGFAQGERTVLRDLSLTVAPGERIAILGESGSGKSTLLSLLIRLSDPAEGAIRLGGIDIRDVATADLHAHIALLTQETPVFIGTIRDNLRIGSPDADDAALFAALARARLADFVRRLPQGLDSWLGEAGETLSAGQARRLCLARTLLSPARILLLDEPTAGLDPETEAELLGDIVGAAEGRTLILATHAALPMDAVDRIYRLDQGRLAPA